MPQDAPLRWCSDATAAVRHAAGCTAAVVQQHLRLRVLRCPCCAGRAAVNVLFTVIPQNISAICRAAACQELPSEPDDAAQVGFTI